MTQPCPEFASFFAGCSEGRQRFTLHDIIGQGAYGVVGCATDRLTGQQVAIKKIKNVFDSVADATRILREITLLRMLKHQDLVEIHHIMLPSDPSVYKDVFVVFELFETDLHTVIEANDDMSPDHFKVFFYQLLRGLNFLHLSGVLHRDLKPRNILANSTCKVKICDLGLARSFSPGDARSSPVMWTDYVATRWYRAPELVGSFYGYYGEAVDVWSLGCIFAEMLLRRPLFPGRDTVSQLTLITKLLGKPSSDTISRIRNSKARVFLQQLPPTPAVPFEDKFPGVDPDALDLLKSMLSFDPALRPTAGEALSHPFFSGLPEDSSKAIPVPQSCFEFEKFQLSERDVRDLIFAEILHYHPEAKALYAEGYGYGSQLMSQLIPASGPYSQQSAPVMMSTSPAQYQGEPPQQQQQAAQSHTGNSDQSMADHDMGTGAPLAQQHSGGLLADSPHVLRHSSALCT